MWHLNTRVNSHQRWKQTRFRVCFHLWCELTSTMNVTIWQASYNSCTFFVYTTWPQSLPIPARANTWATRASWFYLFFSLFLWFSYWDHKLPNVPSWQHGKYVNMLITNMRLLINTTSHLALFIHKTVEVHKRVTCVVATVGSFICPWRFLTQLTQCYWSEV